MLGTIPTHAASAAGAPRLASGRIDLNLGREINMTIGTIGFDMANSRSHAQAQPNWTQSVPLRLCLVHAIQVW